MQNPPDVILSVESGVGLIHLNRPDSLNSLTEGMCRDIHDSLERWRVDDAVRIVVVTGEGERAFCAGGDVRQVWETARKDTVLARAFFATEYALDALISDFEKPYLSLINGIAMGGGLGISVNGCYRVVGERAMAAMPETAIGFFPEVGATAFLNACPGRLGLYLGLSGARLDAADAIHAGLATHFVPGARHQELVETLAANCGTGDDFSTVEGALAEFSFDPGVSGLADLQEDIDRLFAADTVEGILSALEGDDTEFAAKTLAALRRMSPTSLKITARQLTSHPGLDVREALDLEYRIVCHVLERPDFYEGIRAVLVDKDHAPHWSPDTAEDVAKGDVDAYFAPLGEAELGLSPAQP